MRMIKDAFGSLWRGALAIIAASKERRAIRELQAFDRRALADIGIKPGDIEFAVRHGRPSQVNVMPFSRPNDRRMANSSASRERTPPLHVILLILGLIPFGAMLSWGSSATKASSQGELRSPQTTIRRDGEALPHPLARGRAETGSHRPAVNP